MKIQTDADRDVAWEILRAAAPFVAWQNDDLLRIVVVVRGIHVELHTERQCLDAMNGKAWTADMNPTFLSHPTPEPSLSTFALEALVARIPEDRSSTRRYSRNIWRMARSTHPPVPKSRESDDEPASKETFGTDPTVCIVKEGDRWIVDFGDPPDPMWTARLAGLDWTLLSVRPWIAVEAASGSSKLGATASGIAQVEDDPLLDPRMDGIHWLYAAQVTSRMRSAWPGLWEELIVNECATFVWSKITVCPDGRVRPLRLPDMGANGVVPADKMTKKHFDRCEWGYRSRIDGGASQWRDRTAAGLNWTLDHVAKNAYEEWRPVGWPDAPSAKAEDSDTDAADAVGEVIAFQKKGPDYKPLLPKHVGVYKFRASFEGKPWCRWRVCELDNTKVWHVLRIDYQWPMNSLLPLLGDRFEFVLLEL